MHWMCAVYICILSISVLFIYIYILYTVSIFMCSYLHQCICAYDKHCRNLQNLCAKPFTMPECNMASSVTFLIVLVHWRHWLSSHLSTNCGWSPPSHRYAMTCDAILTRSPVEWNWTPMYQIKAQSGPWERGIHWSWVFPNHYVSSEWTSLSPHFVSEIFSIILSMASFVFRFHSVLLECKGPWPRVACPLCFWLVTSGATLCGWNHVNHHLAVCRIYHPSITFWWHYPCGVCHHVWSRPAIPEDLCWCWQSDGGHKRGRQWLTGTHIDISISVAFDLFECLYFSDRLNVTLKSSASLKVAMIVSEPADIWNQIFVSKTSQQKSNCMRLLRMKQWFSIWASLRRQISNLAMFFFRRPVEWRDLFFQDTGTIWDLNVTPFFLDMLVICSMWSVFGHGWNQWPFSQFAIEKHLFCCAFCKNHISWDARQQIFTCQVFTEQGALLWRLEDVIFRKVAGQGVECHGHGGGPWRQAILGQVWGCFKFPVPRCSNFSRFPMVFRSWCKPCLAEPAQAGCVLALLSALSHFISLRLPVESPDISAAHRTVARYLDTSLRLEVYQ